MKYQSDKYRQSALKRAQRELQDDPDKYRRLGAAGGSKKVPKGLARMDEERKQEIIGKAHASRSTTKKDR